jgi:hypothetical protein
VASKKPPKPSREQPKPSRIRTVQEILANANDALGHAEQALRDFMDDDLQRQRYGLRTFITSARSVTFVLQTMKHTVPDAEAWYADLQARLMLDEIAKAFVELRNQIEKEGVTPAIERSPVAIYIKRMSDDSLRGIVPPGRPYAIGEGRSGGNYWLDPRGRRHYFRLPEQVGQNWGGSRFSDDAPDALRNQSVEELAHYYLELMEKAVAEACGVPKLGPWPQCLCSVAIFVDEAAEDWVADDRGCRVGRCRLDWGRWPQSAATVWALLVVVGDVLVQQPS